MLVLGRRVGESVIIDGKVKVKILHTKAGSILIGIDAPDEVRIMRREVLVKEDSRRETARS